MQKSTEMPIKMRQSHTLGLMFAKSFQCRGLKYLNSTDRIPMQNPRPQSTFLQTSLYLSQTSKLFSFAIGPIVAHEIEHKMYTTIRAIALAYIHNLMK